MGSPTGGANQPKVSDLIAQFETRASESTASKSAVPKQQANPNQGRNISFPSTAPTVKQSPKQLEMNTASKFRAVSLVPKSGSEAARTDQVAQRGGIRPGSQLEKLRQKHGGKIPNAPKTEQKLLNDLDTKVKGLKEIKAKLDQANKELGALKEQAKGDWENDMDVLFKEGEIIHLDLEFQLTQTEADNISKELNNLQETEVPDSVLEQEPQTPTPIAEPVVRRHIQRLVPNTALKQDPPTPIADPVSEPVSEPEIRSVSPPASQVNKSMEAAPEKYIKIPPRAQRRSNVSSNTESSLKAIKDMQINNNSGQKSKIQIKDGNLTVVDRQIGLSSRRGKSLESQRAMKKLLRSLEEDLKEEPPLTRIKKNEIREAIKTLKDSSWGKNVLKNNAELSEKLESIEKILTPSSSANSQEDMPMLNLEEKLHDIFNDLKNLDNEYSKIVDKYKSLLEENKDIIDNEIFDLILGKVEQKLDERYNLALRREVDSQLKNSVDTPKPEEIKKKIEGLKSLGLKMEVMTSDNPKLQKDFVQTYRWKISTTDLLQEYRTLINKNPGNEKLKKNIHSFCNAWLSDPACHRNSIDEITQIRDFINDANFTDLQGKAENLLNAATQAPPPSTTAPLPKPDGLNAHMERKEFKELKKMILQNDKKFAQAFRAQVTNKQTEILGKISQSEFEKQAWMKSTKATNAPNIVEMIALSNNLSNEIVAMVLSCEENKDERNSIVEFFLEQEEQFFNQGNFDAAMAIHAGLSSAPVYRLLKKHQDSVKSSLVASPSNVKEKETDLKEKNRPVIPFMGDILTNIVKTDDGNPGLRPKAFELFNKLQGQIMDSKNFPEQKSEMKLDGFEALIMQSPSNKDHQHELSEKIIPRGG